MTSYFDDLRVEVREASEFAADDEAFLSAIEEIEEGVIPDITLVTGDREFPEDLRDKILGLIAVHRTKVIFQQPPTRAREMNLRMRRSDLLEKLHSAFHEVGSRRIKTRFGTLSDHPRANLLMRENHEKENEDG